MAAKIYLQRSAKRNKESGTRHRIAGLVALAVVAIIGTMQWKHWPPNVASADPVQHAAVGGDALPVVEYFPGKYKNQAIEAEKPTDSF